jgi:hypothetical protein
MNALPPPRPSASAACGITSHAVVECRLSQLAALRERPAPAAAPSLPPRFLRQCDEHTVVALHAVLEAIASSPQPPRCDRHAVVAAPCQSGRITAARTLVQFRAGGGVTVSPHVVPQCSLHSLAGAVSVALGMHGPHIGVGGGPDALAEGLWTALTFVQHEAAAAGCDGAWVVFSEWDDEPAIDAAGAAQGDPLCRALALLLEPLPAVTPLTLSFHVPAAPKPQGHHVEPCAGLASFARAICICVAGSGALASWSVPCPWGGHFRVASRPLRLREAA